MKGAPEESIILIVGDKRAGPAYAILAYRRGPAGNKDRNTEEIDDFFRKAKETVQKLTDMGYLVITAGMQMRIWGISGKK